MLSCMLPSITKVCPNTCGFIHRNILYSNYSSIKKMIKDSDNGNVFFLCEQLPGPCAPCGREYDTLWQPIFISVCVHHRYSEFCDTIRIKIIQYYLCHSIRFEKKLTFDFPSTTWCESFSLKDYCWIHRCFSFPRKYVWRSSKTCAWIQFLSYESVISADQRFWAPSKETLWKK